MKMTLVGVVIVVVAASAAYEAYRIADAYEKARPILASAAAFQKQDGDTHVLVAGDSTGVGTGADSPEDSVAGRLSADNPEFAIDNVSVNGMRIADLLELLRSIPEEKRYALVLLQIGGNDILNFASAESVRENLRIVFDEAKKGGERVVLISTGNVGNAPAFGPVLSYVYELRSKEYRDMFIAESTTAGVAYVDLYESKETDPFALEPLKYHAADGLHPSSDGYGLWYAKLKTVLEAGY